MMKKIGWRRLRLATQLLFWALLLLPLAGFPWFRGTYVSSRFLGLPLTDSFAAAQVLAAGGRWLAGAAALGLVLVILLYLIFGRAFCAWVCPLGSLMEGVDWIGARLLPNRWPARRAAWPRWSRWAVALLLLLLSAATGQALFEWLSPQATLMRSLLFGLGLQLTLVALALLFDLFVLRRGWCRSVCPAGALYSLLGRGALLRVGHDRATCDRCGRCIQVCPMNGRETLLETVAGRGPAQADPWVCSNCGDCIDACPHHSLGFVPVWRVQKAEKPARTAGEDRRRALGILGGAVLAAGISVARPMLAAPAGRRLLRPPGALPEPFFLGLCLRCGQCAQACPRSAIRIARWEHGLSTGTPYIAARETACDLCGGQAPACAAVCPTQALHLEPGEPVRMGTAVIDATRCLAHMGDICRSCFNACPLRGRAIVLEGALRPVVDPALCTGCGLCEEHCLVEPAAIHVEPLNP
ncbi:4Fe-4S dicluster domain-containing protein [Symbiobacterium thermophilum]|uniref:4Fe-4S dicluster domain-containing protein n=1 Tax=Symbiobacterium thermophilum TaxID=2734 RepID=UPI0035C6645B